MDFGARSSPNSSGSASKGSARTVSSPRASTSWTVTNALVLAHYFADAFLYRFRIPRVREVTLGRLGLV